MARMTKHAQRKQQAAPRSAPALSPVSTKDRPPIDPLAVRRAAIVELVRMCTDRPVRFTLPEPEEQFYTTTAEAAFCRLLQGGYGHKDLAVASGYHRETIIEALAALSFGADISRVEERWQSLPAAMWHPRRAAGKAVA